MIDMIGTGVFGNMDYPVFSENYLVKPDICVFDTEYRVIQRMKRINAGFLAAGKCNCHLAMGELLAAANGVTAYDFSLKTFLRHVKEYGNAPDGSVTPMTAIAWKNLSGRVFCSVERVFLTWDNSLSLEDNLFGNAYMEQSARVTFKLLRECYHPLGVIGKGDYIQTLRKVFADQFGYIVI